MHEYTKKTIFCLLNKINDLKAPINNQHTLLLLVESITHLHNLLIHLLSKKQQIRTKPNKPQENIYTSNNFYLKLRNNKAIKLEMNNSKINSYLLIKINQLNENNQLKENNSEENIGPENQNQMDSIVEDIFFKYINYETEKCDYCLKVRFNEEYPLIKLHNKDGYFSFHEQCLINYKEIIN